MARRAAILQKLVDRLAAVVYPFRNCQESFALAAHFLAQQIRHERLAFMLALIMHVPSPRSSTLLVAFSCTKTFK